MLRKINYTGRQRITRDKLGFRIRRSPAGGYETHIKLGLDGKRHLPLNAPVYIEAYNSSSFQRIRIGTVADAPIDRTVRFDQVDGPASVLFRVKVVQEDGEHGQIISSADRIAPEFIDDAPRSKSILPTVFDDLGQDLWRVTFEDAGPILEVNNSGLLKDIARDYVRSDPSFVALVYPEITRVVLTHILIAEEYSPSDDDEDRWEPKWLQFARRYASRNAPETEEHSVLSDWINETVAGFARSLGARSRIEEVLRGGA
jgi:hypothetical protein